MIFWCQGHDIPPYWRGMGGIGWVLSAPWLPSYLGPGHAGWKGSASNEGWRALTLRARGGTVPGVLLQLGEPSQGALVTPLSVSPFPLWSILPNSAGSVGSSSQVPAYLHRAVAGSWGQQNASIPWLCRSSQPSHAQAQGYVGPTPADCEWHYLVSLGSESSECKLTLIRWLLMLGDCFLMGLSRHSHGMNGRPP